jgi:hypothetical protein
MLFATISVPLSDWWGNSHAIKKKRLEVQQAVNTCQETSELLLTQMQHLRNAVTEAYQQTLLAQESIAVAEENVRQNEEHYRAGVSILSDLLDAQSRAYGEYTAGVLTADDVHLLGFLLPGETGGHHDRTEATDVVAEVKVKVVNEDFICVVIDQSAGENAAQVVYGWPDGVKNALIVITAADGQTEVYRQFTTRLHNDIRLPEGSHGKQFIIKESFLKHINDEPRFGNEPTFSMPLTTEDLAAALDRQHHAEFEAQMQEVERQRQEIERLHAELNANRQAKSI